MIKYSKNIKLLYHTSLISLKGNDYVFSKKKKSFNHMFEKSFEIPIYPSEYHLNLKSLKAHKTNVYLH